MPNSLIINAKHYRWVRFWKLVYKNCGGSLRQAQIYLFMSRNKDNAMNYATWLSNNRTGLTTVEVDYNKDKMESWIETTFYNMPPEPKRKGSQKITAIGDVLALIGGNGE